VIAHRIASHLPMEITQKQELLETIRPDQSSNQDEQNGTHECDQDQQGETSVASSPTRRGPGGHSPRPRLAR